jgi:hypothetical protein
MKRTLQLEGIIIGELMRDIIEIFPETKDSFRQRKTYDEYYYDETVVEVDLDRIESVNNYYLITFSKEYIHIE